jgi:hypothetical protein
MDVGEWLESWSFFIKNTGFSQVRDGAAVSLANMWADQPRSWRIFWDCNKNSSESREGFQVDVKELARMAAGDLVTEDRLEVFGEALMRDGAATSRRSSMTPYLIEREVLLWRKCYWLDIAFFVSYLWFGNRKIPCAPRDCWKSFCAEKTGIDNSRRKTHSRTMQRWAGTSRTHAWPRAKNWQRTTLNHLHSNDMPAGCPFRWKRLVSDLI